LLLETKWSGKKNLDGKSIFASVKSLISSFIGTIINAVTLQGNAYGFSSY